MNEPLTATDLQELKRMLAASGLAHAEHLQKAKTENNGLGLFVRSLVGLDREAAKQVLACFMAGKNLSANQIEFVNLIVNHLTERGVMEAGCFTSRLSQTLLRRGQTDCFQRRKLTNLFRCLEKFGNGQLLEAMIKEKRRTGFTFAFCCSGDSVSAAEIFAAVTDAPLQSQ